MILTFHSWNNKPYKGHEIGNFVWRRPEGHLGKGIGKHSEVFSFGLVVSGFQTLTDKHAHKLQCFFVITGTQWLIPPPQLEPDDNTPEVLARLTLITLLKVLGPLPDGLVSHVRDEEPAQLLRELWELVQEKDFQNPMKDWSEDYFPGYDHGVANSTLRRRG